MIKKIVETDQEFLNDTFCKKGAYRTRIYFLGIKLIDRQSKINNQMDAKGKKEGVGFAQ